MDFKLKVNNNFIIKLFSDCNVSYAGIALLQVGGRQLWWHVNSILCSIDMPSQLLVPTWSHLSTWHVLKMP